MNNVVVAAATPRVRLLTRRCYPAETAKKGRPPEKSAGFAEATRRRNQAVRADALRRFARSCQ
jgi:hypothetical protein